VRPVTVIIAVLLAGSLQAQQGPISADRPGFADGPATVGARTLQLEVGGAFEVGDGSLFSLPTLLRIGITDALEMRIESSVVGVSDGDSDLAPLSAGFKLRLNDGEIPISLLASVRLPSGEGQLRSTELESEVRLLGQLDVAPGLSLTPNVGISLVDSETPGFVLATTLEKEAGNATPFIDFEMRREQGQTSMIVDGGAAWIVGTETQLDVAGGVGIAGNGYPDWFVTAGISRRF
jgi:hypothetical protein